MAISEAVADKIASDGHGTVGTNLFIGLMPDAPDACSTVYEGVGPGLIEHFGGGVALDLVSVQVTIRGARDDYPTARNLALSIRNDLADITEETVSEVRILRMKPEGYINSIGRDPEDRPLFTINFIATIVP